jgi:hypothetical protein
VPHSVLAATYRSLLRCHPASMCEHVPNQERQRGARHDDAQARTPAMLPLTPPLLSSALPSSRSKPSAVSSAGSVTPRS